MDLELDLDLDFSLENEDNFVEDKFDEDYFLTTNEKTRTKFDLTTSIEKLKNNNIVPNDNETIRCISPASGWSSCSLLMAISNDMIIDDLIITTLRVGKKELDQVINLKQSGKLKKVTFALSGISKENNINGKKYDYAEYFERTCDESEIKYKYVKNHSKVILINSNKGKYIIETSSNFNENPKVEQFIITKSKKIYDYYIMIFKKIGVID